MDASGAAQRLDGVEAARSLRAAGLKVTRPRLLVLNQLKEKGGHVSADDVVAALKARRTPLTRASVYNALAALLAHGLVMLTDVGPGKALYELAEHWHHHFVCRTCGGIEDVACVIGRRPCLDAKSVAGKVDEAQVIFRGICNDCLGKRGRDNPAKRSRRNRSRTA
jgi:Fur family ferric uptake transcriptional regulator